MALSLVPCLFISLFYFRQLDVKLEWNRKDTDNVNYNLNLILSINNSLSHFLLTIPLKNHGKKLKSP